MQVEPALLGLDHVHYALEADGRVGLVARVEVVNPDLETDGTNLVLRMELVACPFPSATTQKLRGKKFYTDEGGSQAWKHNLTKGKVGRL